MELFDELEKECNPSYHLEIVRKGYISKIMPEYHQEIEICDKLRECLLMEEGESYCVFSETQRK
jgi:hypothetical protein